jgi:thymidylate synthase
MKVYDTIHEAYLGTLEDIYFSPDFKSSPRGQACREKCDYTFKVRLPVAEAIKTRDESRNRVIREYTEKEVVLYNSCTNSAEDFGKASKFWLSLANPDGTVNSAYGHLIWAKKSHGSDFEVEHAVWSASSKEGEGNVYVCKPVRRTPWEWAKESLIRDKDTRQAVLRFSLPEHQWVGNKDQTCTMHGNFLIRENKLNLSVVMRSNDLVLGLVYDLPWFVSLMDRMVAELKPHYPDLEVGSYTHTVHSLHIYEKNEQMVKKMLGLESL